MHVLTLPYQADGAALFSHFAQQPYAVFFDSCGVDRFDILAAEPTQVIVTQDWRDDPLRLAKAQLVDLKFPQHSEWLQELPFTVGIMGYLSYDLGYGLENLTPTVSRDVDLPTAVLGFYEWSIVTDHQRRITVLISVKPSTHPELLKVQERIRQITPVMEPFSLDGNFSPNLNQAQYAAAFKQVQQHIHAGDCYQINLAQRFSAAFQGSTWTAYQRLRAKNPMPMASYMNLGNDAAILCLSPERFLKIQNHEAHAQPIKGTSSRFSDPVQDSLSAQSLLNSTKDRAENIMIVDLLRNDLSKCCKPGSVQVPRLCALESFTNVHHLVSDIRGTLEPHYHPLDLLKHCFPGGSITGAPKRRAMEIIDQLEPQHRSVYCGAMLYCDTRGRMDSNITIRTLLCSGQKIHCYGGGGIVSDSLVESEYQEIQIKISKLLSELEK